MSDYIERGGIMSRIAAEALKWGEDYDADQILGDIEDFPAADSGRLYSISRSNIPARCYSNAKAAAYGQVECPRNVVFQAGFRQGRGVYERGYNTYFCYG